MWVEEKEVGEERLLKDLKKCIKDYSGSEKSDMEAGRF